MTLTCLTKLVQLPGRAVQCWQQWNHFLINAGTIIRGPGAMYQTLQMDQLHRKQLGSTANPFMTTDMWRSGS